MENAFSEKYKYAFRNLELKELRRFILKELISSPELDNQLTNLIVLLNKTCKENVCRISGCKSTEFAQRHGREGIKLMGQKFFDMHESSRLNMSFNCSGAFNIIYIMRSMMMENGKQPPSVNQSYNQRPALADAMSIPIVNSGA